MSRTGRILLGLTLAVAFVGCASKQKAAPASTPASSWPTAEESSTPEPTTTSSDNEFRPAPKVKSKKKKK